MPRIIEEAVVKIGADTRQLKKGMGAANKGMKAFKRTLIGVGAAMGVAFGGRAMVRGFQRTLQSTNELIKTAKGVGFLASEYERLTFSLSQVGVNAGSAKIALGDFQKRLGKAVAGTSPQFAKAFRDAGLDPKSLAALDPAAAFNVALEKLATFRGDPRLAGLTGNVFEEQSGKDILQVIRQWEKYLATREKFSRRVGGLTKDQQFRVEFLSEELGVYKAQWGVLKQKIVSDAVPSIVIALEQLEAAGVFTKLGESVVGLAGALATAATNMGLFVAAAERGDDIFGGSLSPFRGGLTTPKGALSPQEISEDLAGKQRIRMAPGLAKSHIQRENAAGMTLEVNVTGDTANARDLARRIAVEVQKQQAVAGRAGP